VYVIGERAAARAPLEEVLRRAAAGGARYVQVREPGLRDREVVECARRLVRAVRPLGAAVLVNDRLDLALAAGADGVHLKSSGIPTRAVRRAAGEGFLVARSTHAPAEAEEAAEEGADLVVFGPVFATPSKAAYGPPVGLSALREAARRCRAPLYALGGVDATNARACIEAGAAGVAVVRAVMAAEDPGAAVEGLRAAAGRPAQGRER
jgi:thiamine-phosphate pyrophosphorylase